MRRPSLCTVTPWILAGGLLLASCGGTPEPTDLGEALGATSSPSPVAAGEASEPAAELTPDTDAASDAPADVEPIEPTAEPARDASEVCDGREAEAFIELLTPTDGTSVTSPFTMTGCGNTFEATYQWRVTLADGTVAAQGFGTMTCGSGCVGMFDEELTVPGTGPATLRVFEESAEDGSEVNVVEVQIILS